MLEDNTVLEFLVADGIVCPSCNQDFLYCLANEPPNCFVLSLTPEQLVSGRYARVVKWEDLTERDRFIKNFTDHPWPDRPSQDSSAQDKEPRLLVEMSDGRLLEFPLDENITCPSCDQFYMRCVAFCALGMSESAKCVTLDLTPEQMIASGYARIVERNDVTPRDRLVTDFSAYLEKFKLNILTLLLRDYTTDAKEIEKTMEAFVRELGGKPSTITEFSDFLKGRQAGPSG